MPIRHRARWMMMDKTLLQVPDFGQTAWPAGAVSGSGGGGATGVDDVSTRVPTKPEWPWRTLFTSPIPSRSAKIVCVLRSPRD